MWGFVDDPIGVVKILMEGDKDRATRSQRAGIDDDAPQALGRKGKRPAGLAEEVNAGRSPGLPHGNDRLTVVIRRPIVGAVTVGGPAQGGREASWPGSGDNLPDERAYAAFSLLESEVAV